MRINNITQYVATSRVFHSFSEIIISLNARAYQPGHLLHNRIITSQTNGISLILYIFWKDSLNLNRYGKAVNTQGTSNVSQKRWFIKMSNCYIVPVSEILKNGTGRNMAQCCLFMLPNPLNHSYQIFVIVAAESTQTGSILFLTRPRTKVYPTYS